MAMFAQMQLSKAPVQLLARISKEDDLYSPTFICQSDLQYSGISIEQKLTVWVTSAAGRGSPVKGAKVTVMVAESSEKPAVGPSCTTGGDGTCTMDLASFLAKQGYLDSSDIWVTVKSDKEFLLVPEAAETPYYYP